MRQDKNGDITLNETDFQKWQKDAQELQQQIGGLTNKLMMLHKKIEAFMLFRAESNPSDNQSATLAAANHVAPPISKAMKIAGATLPDHIMSVFTPGEKKTNAQIKEALKQRGIDNLGSNDAYYYTSVSRLVKKGQLVKEGKTYRKAA